jgi:hypothetical protein
MSQPASGRRGRGWSCCFAVVTIAALSMACGDTARAAPEPPRAAPGKGAAAAAPPPLPERAPPRNAATPGQPPAKDNKVPFGPPLPDSWPPGQVEAALAECRQLLAGQPIEYEILPPIKENACGLPAPIKLIAFNSEPKAELYPPAIVTCKQAVALGQWFNEYVQPAAKQMLQAAVVRTHILASYHCRNRYNDPSQPISNHAFGEAVDIGDFVTAKGENIKVLEHWPTPPPPPPPAPPPPPPVAAKDVKPPQPAVSTPAAASEEREPSREDSSDAERADEMPFPSDGSYAETAGARREAKAPAPRIAAPPPPPVAAPPVKPAPPAKDAKAKPAKKPPQPPVEDARGKFLKVVHKGACEIFGTVLGPEANAAHKNHFHLDVQHRKQVLCDQYGSTKNAAVLNTDAPPAKRSVVERKSRP